MFLVKNLTRLENFLPNVIKSSTIHLSGTNLVSQIGLIKDTIKEGNG